MKKNDRGLLASIRSRIRNEKEKNILSNVLLLLAIGIVIFITWIWNNEHPISYEIYNSETISYDKGYVIEIIDEQLERESEQSNRFLGTQNVRIEMKSGTLKGQEIEVVNTLSTTHNIPLKAGESVIIKVDAPEGVEPFYSVYNYDRAGGMALITVIFLLFLVLIGKGKGIRSALGIFFTIFFLVAGMLPMLYHGYSPVLCCFLAILVTAFVCLSLLTGISKKTLVNLVSVLLGTALVSLFYTLFTSILKLSGYNFDEAEELLLISQNTGMNISDLLFVGVMISSLGAVMDMVMSISSPLFEMKQMKPEVSFKELVDSGFSMGKDMSGTMSQTLILAFVGSALTEMLVLMSYGVSIDQFLSSNYMSIEFLHGIIGGMTVIVSIPITVLISSWFLTRMKNGKTSGKSTSRR